MEFVAEWLGASLWHLFTQVRSPLHSLVEVAAKPCQVLLILSIESCHFGQCLNLTYRADVVELSDGIPYHSTDSRIVSCLFLEKGILLGCKSYLAYNIPFVHVILNIIIRVASIVSLLLQAR